MTFHRSSWHSLLFPWLILSALSTSCATAPKATSHPPLRARDYYPLAIGNSWTYAVSAQGQKTQDEVRLVSQDAEGFFVDTHGSRIMARAEGLFDGDRFLLEEPLEVGHKWLAIPGPTAVEHYETLAIDKMVTVPAGTFRDCVVVQAEQKARSSTGQEGTLQIQWTWAPHVGLVRMVQSVQLAEGERQVNVDLKLMKFRENHDAGAHADAGDRFGGPESSRGSGGGTP